jgi:hypothetical protein
MLLELRLELARGRGAVARRHRAPQARRERDGGALFAHPCFHGARQLLVQTERAVEVLSDLGYEVTSPGLAHVLVSKPDRHEHRDQSRQDDSERQSRLDPAKPLQPSTLNQ